MKKLDLIIKDTIAYKQALALQQDLLLRRQQNQINDTLILLQHPAVITGGLRAKKEHILATDSLLKKEGIEIVETDRGGDVTYHGPGQLTGYIIADLKKYPEGIHDFVRNIEEVFISLLKTEFNLTAGRDKKHPGVWLNNKKITAIGLAVKKGVTMHGFAFNIQPDLNHFKLIIPCGIKDRESTSLKNELPEGEKIDFIKTRGFVEKYFCSVFGYEIENTNLAVVDTMEAKLTDGTIKISVGQALWPLGQPGLCPARYIVRSEIKLPETRKEDTHSVN